MENELRGNRALHPVGWGMAAQKPGRIFGLMWMNTGKMIDKTVFFETRLDWTEDITWIESERVRSKGARKPCPLFAARPGASWGEACPGARLFRAILQAYPIQTCPPRAQNRGRDAGSDAFLDNTTQTFLTRLRLIQEATEVEPAGRKSENTALPEIICRICAALQKRDGRV